MLLENLAGTWRLKALEIVDGDGRASLPYGPDPVGYLAYTSDGFMFVTMRCAERPQAGTQSWFDWTPEQMGRAASGYLTYCGRYALIDDKIEHYIEHSLLPDWVGTTKTRFAKLEGDQLLLSTAPFGSTGISHTLAVLERATSAHL
jgi:Lipocalin-like domain